MVLYGLTQMCTIFDLVYLLRTRCWQLCALDRSTARLGYTPVYGTLSMKIDEIVDSSRILDEIVDSSQWLDENIGYFWCW